MPNAQDWYPRGAVEYLDDHPGAGHGKRVAKLPRPDGGHETVQVHCKKVEKEDEIVLVFGCCCVDDDGNHVHRETPNGPVPMACPEYHHTIPKALIADGEVDVDQAMADMTNVMLGRMQNFTASMRSWQAAPAPETPEEEYQSRIAALEAELAEARSAIAPAPGEESTGG